MTIPLPVRDTSPRRRYWPRLLRWGIGSILVASIVSITAMLYGAWLSTDRLTWSGRADSVITLSGYLRNEYAARCWSEQRARQVWVLRPKSNPFLSLSPVPDATADHVAEFERMGVPASAIEFIDVDAREGDIPAILRALAQQINHESERQIVIECDTLEPRFLRQVADASLDRHLADQLRFVGLPHDQYTPAMWWRSRAGWKDTYVISTQILSNYCFGATAGFELPDWNPDSWEAQTFPQLAPESR